MVIESVDEPAPLDDKSDRSSSSGVTDDPALKDSHSGKSTADDSQASSEAASNFVKKESRHVFFLRVIVLLLLFCASSAISLVVYFITDSAEDDTFESQYYAAAEKVTETFHLIASEKMEATGNFIVALIAHALDREDPWPMVTLSSFQERASTVKGFSDVLYLGFNPVVTREDRGVWEDYVLNDPSAQWYQEGREYQKLIGIDDLDNRPQVKSEDPNLDLSTGVANHIYDFERDNGEKGVISPEADWYLPIWQTSPVTQRSMVNQNRASNSQGAIDCLKYHEIVFEGMQTAPAGYGSDENPMTAEIAWLLRLANGERTKYEGDVFTTIYFPVYDSFDVETRTTVGVLRAVIHWARYFKNLLSTTTEGLVFVLSNDCDTPFTYQIDGNNVIPLGPGDLHDSKYNKYMKSATFADITRIEDGTTAGMKLRFDRCPYQIRVYPSEHMAEMFHSKTPLVITFSVALVFAFAVLMFFAYDRLVERRQRVLMEKAKRTHMIVASLFPKNIRDQILNDDGELHHGGLMGAKNNLKQYVNGNMNDNHIFGQMPIADMYPEATVLFADIAGFTSWSSSREPAQVFVLLQNVYQAFDQIAKKRHVFKVETIGDSYVACAGVPEAEPAHAIKMARFAWDCMVALRDVTRDLETQLGPDTGELSMRFGLNSGPVTAGLLRGDRSRFQLFGDTVNTASRMESTGVAGKIQCSRSTAEILINSGKEHWLEPREDRVTAKGKGILETFWITPYADRAYSANAAAAEGDEEDMLAADFAGQLANDLLKHEREVEWVAELFRDSIRDIVAKRSSKAKTNTKTFKTHGRDNLPVRKSRIPLDEVVDVIEMPAFDANTAESEYYAVKIPDNISKLIREYVSIVAAAYKKNPFHSFEHACHVTLCATKFLKRIVSPDMSDEALKQMKDHKKLASHLHSYTHGIHSDPIALFAILFSAVIHDVDHQGISNQQLIEEFPHMGELYRSKSVAEQNSLSLAMDVLNDSHFKPMREFIFEAPEEFARFRQIVVNVVLATDIFDPELNDLRKKRWAQAFSTESNSNANVNDARATVVIEHIMQASDVCHTMQHWHIYQRFNKKLFEELLVAFKAGRCASSPADFWYEGELKFFDNYIIPLAQKLKDCNIFGVSSDECLNFALRNRMEWEDRGRAIVAEYLEDLNGPKLAPSKHSSPTRSKKNRLEVPPKNSKVKFGDPDLEEESKLSESSSVRAGGSRAIAA